LTNEDYEAVSTKAQRSDISKLLDKTREFMDSPKDVSKATKDTLMEKHDALKKLVDPIQKRRKEELARPDKVAALKNSLEQTEKLVDMIRAQIQQAADAKSKAEEFDASQSASASESADASTTTPAPSDDLADLEEPDSAEPEPTSIAPKYKDASDFSPYTDVDLSEITEAFDSVSKWLADKEKAQAKLKPHEEPVLLVKDVEKKATELSEIMKDLLYKKMKAPPKSSSKKAKSSKTKSSKKGKSSASATAAESVVDEEVTEAPSGAPSGGAERPPESTSSHDEL
jgi:hypoxia up-regulated 1